MASNPGKKALAVVVINFVMLSSVIELSNGALHKVGESAGWTTIGNVDYKQWAVSKTFQLGDVIVFAYNPQFHNVMQVTHAEYKSCNASSPISTHTTGNDSITITTYGHHFFICGVPGHCQARQKVDINVLRAIAPSPLGSPSPVPNATVAAPSPSSANSIPCAIMPFEKFGWILLFLQMIFVFLF